MVGSNRLLVGLHGPQLGGASFDLLDLTLELGYLGLLGGPAVLEGAPVFEGLLTNGEDGTRARIPLHELQYIVQCALVRA